MFKRYIRKHGKRLGPYYYENVRTNKGEVKSVYVGTNPMHHPRHRIRKPLVFLILALALILALGSSLFLLQNKGYLSKKAGFHEPDFDIDQILLKVLVRSGEFIEKQLRVMYTGSEGSSIKIEVSGLEGIIKAEPSSFAIKPGQTKVISLNFSSFIPEQKIEQQPGVYVGKLIAVSEKASKEIPVVIEIETKNVLFDINLNPVAIEKRVKQGADTTIEVRLFNLQSIESANVDVDYFVKDMNGNTIQTESETVVVKTQASFFKTISVPKNLKPGPYVFAALAGFGNSVGTASYLFEVTGPEEASFVQFCKNSILCLGLSLTTILLLFALTAYFYFFVGAYLYEKVTGAVALPGKRKEKAEIKFKEAAEPEAGIFEKIKNRVGVWREERKRKKAERRESERKQGLQKLADERRAQLEAKKRELEGEKRKQEEQRSREELQKQRETEAKKRAEESKKKALERAKALKERKIKLKEFFHKIWLYKTPEEKKQAALLKEKEGLEKENAIKVESKKREELKRQKELEKQKEKQKDEEEERKLQEIKAQKGELVKQIEGRLNNNKEIARQLNSELKRLESEKKDLLGAAGDADARIKGIDKDILGKSKRIQGLDMQKSALFEKYKKQTDGIIEKQKADKALKDAKAKELKEKLAAKQDALLKDLESELGRLSQAKRKETEKWKKLEIKAKIKLEEQSVEEELKKYGAKIIGEREGIESSYKKDAEGISKLQSQIKLEISGLESRKQQILLEKNNYPVTLRDKDNEIQKIKLRLENIAKEREQLYAELSEHKPSLRLSAGLFGRLIAGYREKAERRKSEREKQRLRDEEERKNWEELEKRESQEGKSGRAEEERKSKDEEKAAKERQRGIERGERLKAHEGGKRWLEGLEIAEAVKTPGEKEPEERKAGFFWGLFRKKAPEEAKAQIQKPKSEAEELEEAIKNLGLFKKIESGKGSEEKKKPSVADKLLKREEKREERPVKLKESIFGRAFGKPKMKEELKEPQIKRVEEKAIGKSKKYKKYYKVLDSVKEAVDKKNIPEAKKLYAEARGLYIGLDYGEKKEAYGELMDLYKKLAK